MILLRYILVLELSSQVINKWPDVHTHPHPHTTRTLDDERVRLDEQWNKSFRPRRKSKNNNNNKTTKKKQPTRDTGAAENTSPILMGFDVAIPWDFTVFLYRGGTVPCVPWWFDQTRVRQVRNILSISATRIWSSPAVRFENTELLYTYRIIDSSNAAAAVNAAVVDRSSPSKPEAETQQHYS